MLGFDEEMGAMNKKFTIIGIAAVLVLLVGIACRRYAERWSMGMNGKSAPAQQITYLGESRLEVPIYLPYNTKVAAIEIEYEEKRWHVLLYCITPRSFEEVFRFYQQRYPKRYSRWIDNRFTSNAMTSISRQPPHFYVAVWPDRGRRDHRFFSLLVYPKVPQEDAKALNLTREESNMTYIIASLPEAVELARALTGEKRATYKVVLPR